MRSPPGTLLLADSGLREFPEGDYGGLNITESARLKAASYDPSVQVELGSTCQPPSIIYSMQGPFPMEIYQGRDLVVIKMEYFDVVRIIHMNMDAHQTIYRRTVSGHSIGHWDGDTLIVDTINIKESTFLNNGLDHTQTCIWWNIFDLAKTVRNFSSCRNMRTRPYLPAARPG